MDPAEHESSPLANAQVTELHRYFLRHVSAHEWIEHLYREQRMATEVHPSSAVGLWNLH